MRKLGMTLPEVREALQAITAACTAVPLTLGAHERGLQLAKRYGFSVCDAFIVAAALEPGCSTLYTEDLHDGQVSEQVLTLRNPLPR